MQVRFVGDPAERARMAQGEAGLSKTSVEMYGLKFFLDQAVDVSHLGATERRKLSNHSHFEVVEGEGAAPDAGAENAEAEASAESAPAPRSRRKAS